MENPKRNAKAESTIRNAIEFVKNKQERVLKELEQVPSVVVTLAPAFQWA